MTSGCTKWQKTFKVQIPAGKLFKLNLQRDFCDRPGRFRLRPKSQNPKTNHYIWVSEGILFIKFMAKKVQINGLKGYARSTSIKLETIYEDEQMWAAKKVSKPSVKRRRRWRWWRWRVRIPRLQIRRVLSPSKFLKKLRDAYVRMMLSFEAHGEIGYGAMVLGSHMVHPPVPGRIIHNHDEEEERRFAGIRAQNFRVWGFPWFLNFLVWGLPWFLNFLISGFPWFFAFEDYKICFDFLKLIFVYYSAAFNDNFFY